MAASAATLDLEQLLAPISPDNPCGEYLRWDQVWDELSQLRRTRTDPVDSSRNTVPMWGEVVRLGSELLATRTKDLLLAGWLTEAQLRQKGFPGLRDGLRLVHGLVERFWDQIYPLPEEADYSVRMAPLTWLTSDDSGSRLSAVMREVRLAPSSDGSVLNWNFWHLRLPAPRSKSESEDAYSKRCADAEANKQTFDSAAEIAPITFFQTLASDIDDCLGEIDRLKGLIDECLCRALPEKPSMSAAEIDRQREEFLQLHSPNWNSLQASIGSIRTFVQDVLKRRGYSSSEPVASATAAGEQVTNHQTSSSTIGGPIRSRAAAVARLEEVANFFSETEPHSPVAYLVRRAIRWSGMPFTEVLNELVKDEKLVKQIGETLGIVSPSSD